MTYSIFNEGIRGLREYGELEHSLDKGLSPTVIHGLMDAQVAHIISAMGKLQGRQCLVITHNEIQGKKVYEDLKFFLETDVYFFPRKEILFYHVEAYSHPGMEERLQAMLALLSGRPCIVVASVESLLNRLMPKELMEKNITTIRYGESVDLEELIKKFVILGYERVDSVEAKGQFSLRGGIVDFFPPTSAIPYRVELFDDEVDSIRGFDPETQLSVEKLEAVSLYPAQELIWNEGMKNRAIESLESDFRAFSKKLKGSVREKLREKLDQLIEALEIYDGGRGLESCLPYIYEDPPLLWDYFGRDALVFVEEPSRVREKADAAYGEFGESFKSLLEKGEVLPRQAELLVSYEDLLFQLSKGHIFALSSLPKDNPDFVPRHIVNFSGRMTQSFHGKMDIFLEEIKKWKYRGYKILLICATEERGKSLEGTLKANGIECSYIKEKNHPIQSGQTFIIEGALSKGFEYYSNKLIVITEDEIFGTARRKRTPSKRKDARPIKSFTDLKVDDYVVHENHGIGKYVGIEQLKVQGAKKDYLRIKYSDGGSLYVPIEQMDVVQKYIGAEGTTPKLNKLGGSEWKKTKAKVKGAIEDMAQELLALYAVRQTAKGYAFSSDTPWQRQFEDLFPYEETPDQLRCIEEIKSDMEKAIPMDRLLCGDVGYGKTEVAIRAAFKCVMDGKQVAFLVPTTILAQQHYNTLVQRFSHFPVSMEMLSRFRTDSQQEDIIERLRVGNLDMVVGTHRLLSKDVQFKDLGLLIVDEEQRFGVKHKEALKQLRKDVDVLTLTATPIPRTLHMSLVGLRDMSVIEDPPEERYPIQTYVIEHNDEVIRDAILREVHRGGQVYFVFNRVQGIQQMAARIGRMIPDVRIAVGHGQMSERELENVMLDFLNGEYDVLVCTTIIETGLDISNVNTIIIHDADKMGLSQLYQLRGRVGRSNRLAYAYLTYQKDKVLTEVAEKRLKAIKEFTEFGSGFKIAMRDLEIRGAGNLIGAEQHGHMAAIGYDLYCKLLEDTIHEMKGEGYTRPVETSIEINVNAFIPENYIGNEQHKLEIYKKIASIRDRQDAYAVEEEIEDRFGTVPESVTNLIAIAFIKAMAQKTGISHLTEEEGQAKLQFVDGSKMNPLGIAEVMAKYGNRIQIHAGVQPHLKVRYRDGNQRLQELIELLEKISGFHGN